MLQTALQKARENGFQRITLETIHPLKAAIALYQKHGFTEMPVEKVSSRVDRAFELILCSNNSGQASFERLATVSGRILDEQDRLARDGGSLPERAQEIGIVVPHTPRRLLGESATADDRKQRQDRQEDPQ